ncbi:hypothetical protein [Puia dinghuensis]|nr:hypothetical protein [Puia dinghuensis]
MSQFYDANIGNWLAASAFFTVGFLPGKINRPDDQAYGRDTNGVPKGRTTKPAAKVAKMN